MKKLNLMAALFLAVATLFSAAGAPHRPCLLLTQDGVAALRAEMGKNPLVDKAFAQAKAVADKAVSEPVVVPQPLDVGGGYSHEKHKENYMQMYQAGVVYQLTGEKRYAEFVRRMLLDYAEIYPDLSLHPARFTKTPGKIFYQVLNEAVWLTFTANAYDCVYDHIPAAERERIETRLFRPMVEFMENGVPDNYRAFNSMHNFGTWMAAGTGMIGYVMGDRDLVDKALKGSTKEGKTGFLAQLDALFSPDGYYDEGPGYQRYAIYPFVTLAECIDHNDPGIGVFRYRDGILQKAVNSLLQCTYEGDIFLMNDAIAKDIHTYEILFSADIAYKASPRDKGLLDIVERQGVVTLTDAGAAAAACDRPRRGPAVRLPFDGHPQRPGRARRRTGDHLLGGQQHLCDAQGDDPRRRPRPLRPPVDDLLRQRNPCHPRLRVGPLHQRRGQGPGRLCAREPLLRAALDRPQYGDHRLDDPLFGLFARSAEAGGADPLQRLLGPLLPDRVGHG